MDFFKIECPFCRQRVEVSDNMIGSSVSCPTCHRIFTVPSPAKDDSTPAGEPVMAPMNQVPYAETVTLTESAVKFAAAQAQAKAKPEKTAKSKPAEPPFSPMPDERIIAEFPDGTLSGAGKLFGIRRHGRCILTSERLVIVCRTFVLWGIPVALKQISLLPQGICAISCARCRFSSRCQLRITLADGRHCDLRLKSGSEALRIGQLFLHTLNRH